MTSKEKKQALSDAFSAQKAGQPAAAMKRRPEVFSQQKQHATDQYWIADLDEILA